MRRLYRPVEVIDDHHYCKSLITTHLQHIHAAEHDDSDHTLLWPTQAEGVTLAVEKAGAFALWEATASLRIRAIHVANAEPPITESILKKAFSKYGGIDKVRVGAYHLLASCVHANEKFVW